MYLGQKSIRDGIEDFLCPFENMYITQGSNGRYSHMGIMANDVRGVNVGERCFIYAPCNIKCIKIEGRMRNKEYLAVGGWCDSGGAAGRFSSASEDGAGGSGQNLCG